MINNELLLDLRERAEDALDEIEEFDSTDPLLCELGEALEKLVDLISKARRKKRKPNLLDAHANQVASEDSIERAISMFTDVYPEELTH